MSLIPPDDLPRALSDVGKIGLSNPSHATPGSPLLVLSHNSSLNVTSSLGKLQEEAGQNMDKTKSEKLTFSHHIIIQCIPFNIQVPEPGQMLVFYTLHRRVDKSGFGFQILWLQVFEPAKYLWRSSQGTKSGAGLTIQLRMITKGGIQMLNSPV